MRGLAAGALIFGGTALAGSAWADPDDGIVESADGRESPLSDCQHLVCDRQASYDYCAQVVAARRRPLLLLRCRRRRPQDTRQRSFKSPAAICSLSATHDRPRSMMEHIREKGLTIGKRKRDHRRRRMALVRRNISGRSVWSRQPIASANYHRLGARGAMARFFRVALLSGGSPAFRSPKARFSPAPCAGPGDWATPKVYERELLQLPACADSASQPRDILVPAMWGVAEAPYCAH
jgi:hypothetical protein